MKKDPFEEYIRQSEPAKKELGYAWYTAIGLQAVDGLETSDYLKKTAKDNIDGRITISEAGKLIESYYEETGNRSEDRTKEADIVSVRIAAILSEKAFTFSVPQYIGIHKRLFEGVFSNAGKIRDYNISKKEYEYSTDSISSIIPHLAKFVARLWQIHAFGEGNTRTTAVFFIKYLRSMGFDVTNEIFAENAWYFRNSLVRANYTDLSNGIRETTEYLELFLRNLLLGETNKLKNRYTHIRWEKQKQDIDDKKQDIDDKKQDIDIPDSITNKTKQHIQMLFNEYGFDRFFGRTEVMDLLQITASPASSLIKKMLELEIIYPMKGKGKGKYLFRR
ncbi:MAG: Fic family protein [Lachnospiraceae bacterium]|nr:Fic family protein [Lachnospiraceae bacterium]